MIYQLQQTTNMQKVIEQDNPYVIGKKNCGKCHRCDPLNGPWLSTIMTREQYIANPTFQCPAKINDLSYPHKNNMVVINQNFDYVVNLNRELKEQIQSLTNEIQTLKNIITSTTAEQKTSITTLQEELKTTNTNLTETKSSIISLNEKITSFSNFILSFVRKTSHAFIRMIAGDEHPEQELLQIEPPV